MTAPGFVPRPDRTLVDRVVKLEARLRNTQQNVAGVTTGAGGTPLAITLPTAISPALDIGSSPTSAHADHAHTSALAAQQDVTVTAPAAGHGLVYNGAQWVNAAPAPTAAGRYSRYQGGAVTLAATGSWTLLPWSLSEGAGTGITLQGGNEFTLAAGIWRVVCTVVAATVTGGFTLQLANSPAHGSIGRFFAQATASVSNGQCAATATAEVSSTTGSQILAAFAAPTTAAGTVTVGTGLPSLTFNWSPL